MQERLSMLVSVVPCVRVAWDKTLVSETYVQLGGHRDTMGWGGLASSFLARAWCPT